MDRARRGGAEGAEALAAAAFTLLHRRYQQCRRLVGFMAHGADVKGLPGLNRGGARKGRGGKTSRAEEPETVPVNGDGEAPVPMA